MGTTTDRMTDRPTGRHTTEALAAMTDALDTRLAADALGTPMNPPIRRRSPEQLRDIAREALLGNGYTPVEQPDGTTVYTASDARPAPRRSFAWFTPMSGDHPLAVNARHVESVETGHTHLGGTHTVLTLQSGETILVTDSAEEAVAKLEAVAA